MISIPRGHYISANVFLNNRIVHNGDAGSTHAAITGSPTNVTRHGSRDT